MTLACQSSTQGEGPPGSSTNVIVHANAGSVGIEVPEEGSPESPNGFAVDTAGRAHVLDQVNHRVLTYSRGSDQPKKTELPARDFQDIELASADGSQGYLLLDLYVKPGVVFVDETGKVENEVVLPKADIPLPGLISGLVRDESGVWAQIESTHLVQVADAAGVPVSASVRPGVLVREGTTVRSNARDAEIELQKQKLPAGAPTRLAKLSFSGRVNHHALLGWDKSGALLLSVTAESKQSDPESPPSLSRSLVRLGADGKEMGERIELPVASGAQAGLRNVRMGEDGNVYVMTTTENALQITRVQP